MIKVLTLTFSILIFTACSFATPKNDWQFKSSAAFSSYTRNFLSQKDVLARNDLKRAKSHATQGADLSALAKIYLGKCALDVSVGIVSQCKEYKEISNVTEDPKLDAYYALITQQIHKEQVDNLPNQYQSFTKNILNKDFKNANQEIQNMDKITSKLLCAGLIQDNITIKSIQNILDDASYHGYKKAVLFWLNIYKQKTTSKTQKALLTQKIAILKSVK